MVGENQINPRFINNLIKKELLPEFPGFAGPYENSFFAVPMDHVWRGFCFQKSREVPMWYVSYNVLPLYMPIEFFHVGLGNRLRFDNRYFDEWFKNNIEVLDPTIERPPPATTTVEVWVWDETKAPEVISVLVNTLKSAKADRLDKLRSPLEVGTNGPKLFGTVGWNALEIFAYSLIYVGQFKEALGMLEDLCHRHESMRNAGEEKGRHQINRETMRDLLNANPSAAKIQLLEWEQRSIRILKLEKYTN